MTIRNANGDTLSKTELMALAEQQPPPEPMYRITEQVFQTYDVEGGAEFEQGRRLLFGANTIVPKSRIDALFDEAGVSTITPNSGPAAGGTVVTISGTNLAGVEGVTFGGAAATGVQVIDNNTVQATTPAGVAGVVDVVVADDSGNVTAAGAYTYV